MRVLVGCESSGTVREAFRRRGHDAWSCDLQPADDGSPFHFHGDVRVALEQPWDLFIVHPTCTYLCSSGLHWNARGRMVIDPRNGKRVERWGNQTDSGQNRLGPSDDRWKNRSVTYRGIAEAMAEQWGGHEG